MIKYLRINNVRLFDNGKAEFTLPLLTVFCGTNSCGKSTVVKTLQLLRQSQGLFESYGTRPGTLRFTGAQVDLGNYLSFVSNNDLTKNIEISLEIEDYIPYPVAEHIPKLRSLDISRYRRSQLVPYVLRSSFVFGASQAVHEAGDPDEIKPASPDGVLRSSRWVIYLDDSPAVSWTIRAVRSDASGKSKYKIFIPTDLISEPDSDLSESFNSRKQKTVGLDIDLDGLTISRRIRVSRPKDSGSMIDIRDLPGIIPRAMYDFVSALRRIHYIAPLRAPAKRYYLTNFDITADLDPTGEFLPYFLGGIVEEPRVVHVPPMRTNSVREKLSEALNGWLYYVRTGKTYRSRREGEFQASTHKSALVEIGLKGIRGMSIHSLADSGFGYSQILPILVRALMVPKRGTIIVEQPELHLNPMLQVRLADFFISMVRAGKQVIIETHSEHVVNALRVRTANDTKRFLSQNTKIYFLDLVRNKPCIYDMNIREDGTIPGWPRSFFGEAADLTAELLRAQRRIRKRTAKT